MDYNANLKAASSHRPFDVLGDLLDGIVVVIHFEALQQLVAIP